MYRIITFFCLLLFPILSYSKENVLISNFELYSPVRLPEIEFYDIQNNKYLLEDFDENVVILHFWATWCTVCVKELPELDRLKKDFRKNKIKIITISEDFKGIEAVKEFFNNNDIKNLEIFIDKKHQLFNAFKIIGLPTTIFINKKNQEVARIAGRVDWYSEDLRKKILNLENY